MPHVTTVLVDLFENCAQVHVGLKEAEHLRERSLKSADSEDIQENYTPDKSYHRKFILFWNVYSHHCYHMICSVLLKTLVASRFLFPLRMVSFRTRWYFWRSG